MTDVFGDDTLTLLSVGDGDGDGANDVRFGETMDVPTPFHTSQLPLLIDRLTSVPSAAFTGIVTVVVVVVVGLSIDDGGISVEKNISSYPSKTLEVNTSLPS